MSGSSKKRRNKARRRVQGKAAEAKRLALRAEYIAACQRRREAFDAAYPGVREKYGEGSELLHMVAALDVGRECGPLILEARS